LTVISSCRKLLAIEFRTLLGVITLNTHARPRGAEQRRARQRAVTREEILEAARELVNRHGAEGLTMRAVAQAVGYSPAALYEYFDSKSALLEALYFRGAEGLDGRTRQILAAAGPRATLLERMGLAARAYRGYALEHPELYRLIFTHPSPQFGTLPTGHGHDDSSFSALVGLVREASEREEIAGADPLQLAAALWAFVHGFVMLELTGRLPAELAAADALFEFGLNLLAVGLLPRDDDPKDGAR
jgi:AcrR family transcriptional regulator